MFGTETNIQYTIWLVLKKQKMELGVSVDARNIGECDALGKRDIKTFPFVKP